ncbi:protein ImuA [Nitrospirillum viridazoti]|uniref:Protein ImuA n=1 Tax=Nitrospirillum amazonense TaxID=28077 RepID=A0A560INJ6_9PROT|nr:protein ImuA [Nitrospirillum amazonense]
MIDHAAAITALRAQLSALDRTRPVGGRPPVATGVPALDGGLVCGGIHEVLPGRHCGAGHGFVAAILGRLPESDSRIPWCRAPGPANATLYAPGIAGFGLLPGRLLQVYPRTEEDALWVMEEALRCRRLAAAVGDGLLPSPTQCRRLQLAAAAGDTLGRMLLPPAARPPPSVAMTRWRVAAAIERGDPMIQPPPFLAQIADQLADAGAQAQRLVGQDAGQSRQYPHASAGGEAQPGRRRSARQRCRNSCQGRS